MNKPGYIFDDAWKNSYPRPSWNKVYFKKGYDVIIPVDDFTNKILFHNSNYIVDAFMWPKFGNSSISVGEVITTSIL